MLVTFLRHGQSQHNAGLTPFLDSGLTLLGEQQSLAVARRFANEGLTKDNTVVLVSPFLRTLQTIEPTVQSLSLPAHVFRGVREYFSARNDAYKTFEGLTPSEIAKRFQWATLGSYIGLDDQWWPNDLEDDLQLFSRACDVRDRLVADYFDTNIQLLIVSHADPIGRMIESFLRVSPNLDRPPWSGNCGVTRLSITDPTKPAEIVLMNDLSHLTAESLVSPR
jgi:broad specificity phosphatase PhoE